MLHKKTVLWVIIGLVLLSFVGVDIFIALQP
jgi:hypothetical protein